MDAVSFVQLADGVHLAFGQLKIKDIEVRAHPFRFGGARHLPESEMCQTRFGESSPHHSGKCNSSSSLPFAYLIAYRRPTSLLYIIAKRMYNKNNEIQYAENEI